LKIWDKLKEEYNTELANKVLEPITVTFPDGKTTNAKAWQSTPYEVAKGIRFGIVHF
jgi:threonyl-tRNA synthetase